MHTHLLTKNNSISHRDQEIWFLVNHQRWLLGYSHDSHGFEPWWCCLGPVCVRWLLISTMLSFLSKNYKGVGSPEIAQLSMLEFIAFSSWAGIRVKAHCVIKITNSTAIRFILKLICVHNDMIVERAGDWQPPHLSALSPEEQDLGSKDTVSPVFGHYSLIPSLLAFSWGLLLEPFLEDLFQGLEWKSLLLSLRQSSGKDTRSLFWLILGNRHNLRWKVLYFAMSSTLLSCRFLKIFYLLSSVCLSII